MFYKKINKIIDEHNRFVTSQAINLLDFKNEIETEYLTNRIACCEIGNEMELVRYVEELKDFFNKWNTE